MKALAHITGGGIVGNLPRVLPDQLGAELDAKSWKVPAVFGWIYKEGDLEIGSLGSIIYDVIVWVFEQQCTCR